MKNQWLLNDEVWEMPERDTLKEKWEELYKKIHATIQDVASLAGRVVVNFSIGIHMSKDIALLWEASMSHGLGKSGWGEQEQVCYLGQIYFHGASLFAFYNPNYEDGEIQISLLDKSCHKSFRVTNMLLEKHEPSLKCKKRFLINGFPYETWKDRLSYEDIRDLCSVGCPQVTITHYSSLGGVTTSGMLFPKHDKIFPHNDVKIVEGMVFNCVFTGNA